MADPRGNGSPEAAVPVARVGKRHRVVQQGRIVLGPERLIACTVRDLSRRGAKICLDARHVLPTRFSLVIAAHDLRTLPARLCWRRGDLAGVAFDEAAAS